MFVSGSYNYFLHLGWCCCLHKVQYKTALLSCSYSSASCNHFCMNMKYFPDKPPGQGLRHKECMHLIICLSVLPHPLRARKLRVTANRLFPDDCRASGFPIFEERIEHTWSNDKSVNFVVLQMNFSADLTFASFSSPSLLKTIDHTADKKPSRPTFSNGCGGKNDVTCSRLSDSEEDAKEKDTRKVGGAGKRKKEGRKKRYRKRKKVMWIWTGARR